MQRGVGAILIVGVVFFGASAAWAAGAGPDKDWKNWFGHVGLGYATASGDFGDIVDDEFTFNGGATYWPEQRPFGLNLDLSYTHHDVKSSIVRALNDQLGPLDGSISSADVDVWALSGNLLWGPDTDGAVGFYVLGGVGLDYLVGRVKETGLVYYPPVCDPWWWWCYPGGVGPGTFVRDKESTWELAANAGIGVTFELASGSQIYLEAKYHWIDTDRVDTEIIPLIVGFRW